MDNTGGRYSKQYMVENTHEAIVSHETFDKAQAERARRKNPKGDGRRNYRPQRLRPSWTK